MLGQLDVEIRETRRRLEERRHIRNCLKEAVNDIRRYRRRVKEAQEAVLAPDKTPVQRLAAELVQAVDGAVLDGVLAARDELRRCAEQNAEVESRWSELVAERERRLAPLPPKILDRLGELDERHGILAAHINVAESVGRTGVMVTAALGVVADVLTARSGEADLVVATAEAQVALLGLRRQVKHMHFDAVRLEAELAALLRFTDDLLHAYAREKVLGQPIRESRSVVREASRFVENLMQEAGSFLASRRRKAELLDQTERPAAEEGAAETAALTVPA